MIIFEQIFTVDVSSFELQMTVKPHACLEAVGAHSSISIPLFWPSEVNGSFESICLQKL